MFSIFYRKLAYPFFKKTVIVKTKTFFGVSLYLPFPSGNDIFMTGAKTHLSEIRLAKFLIATLQPNDSFIDVGAHVGYYTLLAYKLIAKTNSILAFEPSKKTFLILQKNLSDVNIVCFNQAISSTKGELEFHETDSLNSEYNSLKNEFLLQNKINFTTYTVPTSPLDDFANYFKNSKKVFIKIDTEGSELDVLNGMKQILSHKNNVIIMEFINNNSTNYSNCLQILQLNFYKSYFINKDGELIPCNNVWEYFQANKIESDNLVFIK
jgi:FkbM family methyltransferase